MDGDGEDRTVFLGFIRHAEAAAEAVTIRTAVAVSPPLDLNQLGAGQSGPVQSHPVPRHFKLGRRRRVSAHVPQLPSTYLTAAHGHAMVAPGSGTQAPRRPLSA